MSKKRFRSYCLQKLKFYSRVSNIKKDKQICSTILDIIDLHKPKKLLVYIPLNIEVNINYLIKYLRRFTKIEIYVPYMSGDSFIAVKYRLPLQKKRFGIKEPKISLSYKKINFDMIIVAIIGIDITYRRIGYGAGMYDRFFERLNSKPITIFTQRFLCKCNKTITSSYDIKPDYIVT